VTLIEVRLLKIFVALNYGDSFNFKRLNLDILCFKSFILWRLLRLRLRMLIVLSGCNFAFLVTSSFRASLLLATTTSSRPTLTIMVHVRSTSSCATLVSYLWRGMKIPLSLLLLCVSILLIVTGIIVTVTMWLLVHFVLRSRVKGWSLRRWAVASSSNARASWCYIHVVVSSLLLIVRRFVLIISMELCGLIVRRVVIHWVLSAFSPHASSYSQDIWLVILVARRALIKGGIVIGSGFSIAAVSPAGRSALRLLVLAFLFLRAS
jgi:hypothetical protein